MSTARVIKGNSFKEFQFDGKTLLSNFTREISLPMPCSGNHTCGKCKVKAEGELSPLSETEKKLLSEDEINGGIRLACCCFALGDCTVTAGDKSGGRVLLEGESKKINHKGFGIAADIGTTTVAVYLYKDGKEISALGEMNRQAPYGGDVISRIGANEPDKLCEIIRNQLQNMFLSAIGGKAAPGEIERIVITGNTAMLHFLRGYNPSSLAVSPFKCVSLFGETIKGEELFPLFKNARVYLPPCISAYVGADTVCAVTLSGMAEKDETSLLCDIGTNGEMALCRGGKLFTCSTAAGPALEGASVKQGMTAAEGAIDKGFINEKGEIDCTVIGKGKAKGIAGSGLISLIALFLKTGLIDETGAIDEENEKFSHLIDEDEEGLFIKIGNSGISLYQKDIRQFQLAKAAVCAGILTLLSASGISADKIDNFFICGGFGSFIDPKAAAETGLIPKELKDKVTVLGNAAAKGAAIMLSDEGEKKAAETAGKAQIIELSESPVFMEEYIEQMGFYNN